MAFASREELYEYIKSNPTGYSATLRGPDHREMLDMIKGMYQDQCTRNVAEKIWLYCHSADTVPKCKCGKKSHFVNIIQGYSLTCGECRKKSRRYNGVVETQLRSQEGKSIPKCDHPKCEKPVAVGGNGIWKSFCSNWCRHSFNSLKSRQTAGDTMMANYGVRNALQCPVILGDMQSAMIKRHGATNPMQVPGARENQIKTNMAKYGVPNAFSSDVVRQKYLGTLKEKYGEHVTNPSQIPGVQQKKLLTGYQAKDYTYPSGNVIKVQGYEGLFLDIALKQVSESDISHDLPAVLYRNGDTMHHYFPDFKIGDRYIEVKSDYTFYDAYDINILKSRGVIEAGHELIFCVFRNGVANMLVKNAVISQKVAALGNDIMENHTIGNYIVDVWMPSENTAIVFKSGMFQSQQHYGELGAYLTNQNIKVVMHD